jgi:hypothetical protein
VNPGRGRLRVWRGLTLASACVVLATVAHVAAGGGWPAHGPFVICAILLAVACVALADQQRTLGAIAAVIVLTQPPLHVVLALSSHGSAAVVPSPGMVAAHAAAAALLTVLLAGGEAIAWSMAALETTVLGSAARAVLAWSPDPRPVLTVLSEPRDLPFPYRLILAADTPGRGPPVIAGV